MHIYLVGGIVRDRLLGIANEQTEKDYVVIGSSVKEMLGFGYKQVGKNFPIFLHPQTNEEYALARLESKSGVGYKGFTFNVAKNITLEQDLKRRDLTINAMAMDGNGKLIDFFNGKQDLNNRLLKHVSANFSDDPVRVLRVARFASQFKPYGFKVAGATNTLMKAMAMSGELKTLTPERIFKELIRALSYDCPVEFFKVLSRCGALAEIFPALKYSIMKKNYINRIEFLDNIDNKNTDIKFSVWLSMEKLPVIQNLCKVIKCPKKYEELALLSAQYLPLAKIFIKHSAQNILDFFIKTDALRRKARFDKLLAVFAFFKVDIKPIINLKKQLMNIDVSTFDKLTIQKAVSEKRLEIINLFLALPKIQQ